MTTSQVGSDTQTSALTESGARKVLGTGNVFGTEAVNTLLRKAARAGEFGLTKLAAADMPPIPFSAHELSLASRLGQILFFIPPGLSFERILAICSEGLVKKLPLVRNPELFSSEPFYSDTTEPSGWKLITPGILTRSVGKNYYEQTHVLADHVKKAFSGKLPTFVKQTLEQFDDRSGEVGELLREGKFKEAAALLFFLTINSHYRPSPTDLLWLYCLERDNDLVDRNRLRRDLVCTSRRCSESNLTIVIGRFGHTDGAIIRGVAVDQCEINSGTGFCRAATPPDTE